MFSIELQMFSIQLILKLKEWLDVIFKKDIYHFFILLFQFNFSPQYSCSLGC